MLYVLPVAVDLNVLAPYGIDRPSIQSFPLMIVIPVISALVIDPVIFV